jgi:hypothetical protein
MVWFLYAGASLGVAAYFRPAILPVALFWILLLGFSRRLGPARLFAASAVICVPVVALLLPWWIRNFEVFHRFIPTNSGFSMAVWEGIGETSNPFGALGEDGLAYRQYKREGGSESYFSVTYSDDYYAPKIKQALKSRPFWFGKLLARRLFGVLTYPYDWGFEEIRCIWIRIAKRLFTLGLLLSGFAGVWIRGGLTADDLALLSVCIVNVHMNLLVSANARYMVPGDAILLLFSASFFIYVGDTFVRKRVISRQQIPIRAGHP